MPFNLQNSLPTVVLAHRNARSPLPFDSNYRVPALSGPQPPYNAPSRSSAGSYGRRMNRFDARSRRRYGDWGDLDLPVLMLWAESNFAPDCDDDSCENPF